MAYDIATYDRGSEAPGTRALWNVIRTRWPAASFLGIYARRAIRGSDKLSLHAEGRALDFIPPDTERDKVAEWARSNADALGLQEIIVYETRRIWTTSRAREGWRPYKGVSKGLSHLHLGQHRTGAGIAGGSYDADVLLRSMKDVAEADGVRWWQPVLLVGAFGGLVAIERTGVLQGRDGRR